MMAPRKEALTQTAEEPDIIIQEERHEAQCCGNAH